MLPLSNIPPSLAPTMSKSLCSMSAFPLLTACFKGWRRLVQSDQFQTPFTLWSVDTGKAEIWSVFPGPVWLGVLLEGEVFPDGGGCFLAVSSSQMLYPSVSRRHCVNLCVITRILKKCTLFFSWRRNFFIFLSLEKETVYSSAPGQR